MALAVILNLFNSKDPSLTSIYGPPFNGIAGTQNLYCKININLTLRVYYWNQMDFVPFVHSWGSGDPPEPTLKINGLMQVRSVLLCYRLGTTVPKCSFLCISGVLWALSPQKISGRAALRCVAECNF